MGSSGGVASAFTTTCIVSSLSVATLSHSLDSTSADRHPGRPQWRQCLPRPWRLASIRTRLLPGPVALPNGGPPHPAERRNSEPGADRARMVVSDSPGICPRELKTIISHHGSRTTERNGVEIIHQGEYSATQRNLGMKALGGAYWSRGTIGWK